MQTHCSSHFRLLLNPHIIHFVDLLQLSLTIYKCIQILKYFQFTFYLAILIPFVINGLLKEILIKVFLFSLDLTVLIYLRLQLLNQLLRLFFHFAFLLVQTVTKMSYFGVIILTYFSAQYLVPQHLSLVLRIIIFILTSIFFAHKM